MNRELKTNDAGYLYIEYAGVEVTNPFMSVCGRFKVYPWEAYQVSELVARDMVGQNRRRAEFLGDTVMIEFLGDGHGRA